MSSSLPTVRSAGGTVRVATDSPVAPTAPKKTKTLLDSLDPGPGPTRLSKATERPSFAERLSKRLAQAMTVEVPLVAIKDAKLWTINTAELAKHGAAMGPNGLIDWAYEREVVGAVAFRPATEEEIKQGRFTHVGTATRYHSTSDGKKKYAVMGDGRAVLAGQLLVREKKTGRITQVFELQLKGVETGLRPLGVPRTDHHGTGKAQLGLSIRDALMAGYLRANGIKSTSWVAVVETGEENRHRPVGMKEDTVDRAAVFVRGGNFLRVAHLRLLKDDPGGTRELLDHLNDQLCLEYGRTTRFSHSALYQELIQRKAEEVAQMYWARTLHGSPSMDNVGLLDDVDHATAVTLGRADSFSWKNFLPSFPKEGAWILNRYYVDEVRQAFLRSANEEEAKELGSLDPLMMAEQVYQRQMAIGALEHLGLDQDQVGWLIQHERASVDQPSTVDEFLKAVRSVGEQPVPGGCGARYDIFSALSVLLRAAADPVRGQSELIGKLAPAQPNPERDQLAAQKLLAAVAPILERVKGQALPEVQLAMLSLIEDQAVRINAPVMELSSDQSWQLVSKLRDPSKSIQRVRAEFNAVVRGLVRTGPDSAGAVAMRIRHSELDTVDADRKLRLSRLEENGVAIEELSDGHRDLVRFAIAGDPLGTHDPWKYRLRFDLGDGPEERGCTRVEEGVAIFDVPLEKPPKLIRASFSDATGKTYDQDGMGFGVGLIPVLGSKLVDAELAAHAARRGGIRTGTPPAMLAAVSSRPLGSAAVLGPEPAYSSRAHEVLAAHPEATPSRLELPSGLLACELPKTDWDRKLLVANPQLGRAFKVQWGFANMYAQPDLQLRLGAPLQDEQRDGPGAIQRFEGGTLRMQPGLPMWIDPTDAELARMKAATSFFSAEAERLAVTPEGAPWTLASGALAQPARHPMHGQVLLLADPSGSRAVSVRSGFLAWYQSAYVQSLLGRPLAEEESDGMGALQRFERGVLRHQPPGLPPLDSPYRTPGADVWIEPS